MMIPVITFSQDLKPNKKIKSNEIFQHTTSTIAVPLNLGEFVRTGLFTNSKNDSVLSAEYENKNNDAQFKFKIVPALLHEERLLNHYYKDLNERRYTPKQSERVDKIVIFKEGRFTLRGISTYFKHLNRLINVRVYDAGFWVFISEMSQEDNDTLALNKRHDEFLNILKPAKIVENNPLTRYSNIVYAPAAARDTTMLRITMSSSLNKMKWIYENIDKYERASGIPGTLLDFQIAGINGFIDYKTEKNPNSIKEGNPAVDKLISFFTKLRNDGFTDEYLMEQYYYLLSPAENHQFDYKGYQKWKLENSIDYNVDQKYYIIENVRRKTNLNKDE
ncbi:hypothetical protein [Chryseobacterium sp. W4I1]|uniref:hypothetical protein n=1 Tax=Chryseobacterium sp. W4I1 TaxID=3042293 RepID=UPI002780A1D2|nr:hypothetical protein [Chryseobacterium sp. W4I1]MDQ0782255.1 DNA-binding transcriptional MerR regulator [Chryseobacterium sp. W4I1]